MRHLSDIGPGQVIGRYEILSSIARGGMADVWVARQRGSRGFSKLVAIKTMLPTISDDPRFERMFLDEAQIASRIRHSNVVEILDLGEEDAILYLVMEWVDGESLSSLRRQAAERGGIPLRLALRIVADVCAGLHAAHELVDDEGRPFGLVHRDVSPQNILVGYGGNVKILDFGVAKVAGRSADTTGVGHARGKPPYMAPEQAFGREVDRRADIFALGIVLYQLLTGRHPFRGENDIATLHNIISDQPVIPPSALVAAIQPGLNATVLCALEREPERRYQTAYEFELALEAALDHELGRVRPEEIRGLMGEAFGSAGEDRRNAIRDAIRRADAAEPTCVDVRLALSELNDAGEATRVDPLEREPHWRHADWPADESAPSSGVGADGRDVRQATLRSDVRRTAGTLGVALAILVILAVAMGTWFALSKRPATPRPEARAEDSAQKSSPRDAPVRHDLLGVPQPTTHGGETPASTGVPKETRERLRATPQRRTRSASTAAAGGRQGNPYNGLPPVPLPGF